MAPGSDSHEIFRITPGMTSPIISIATRLRAPAIATGDQSMDLIRTPPRDQRVAAGSKSKTFLFNGERAGIPEVQELQEFRRQRCGLKFRMDPRIFAVPGI